MKIRYLTAVLLVAAGNAGPALARHEPTPPPSGIVVHLFGPGSVMSNILPNDLGNGAAGGGGQANPAAGTGAGVAGAGGGAESDGAPAAAADYPEPTMHQILHEMFVTGDPNMKPGSNLATGRKNDHP